MRLQTCLRAAAPVLALLLLAFTELTAQDLRPADRIATVHETTGFEEEFQPLTRYAGRSGLPELDQYGADYELLTLDAAAMTDLIDRAPESLVMQVPTSDERSTLQFELVRTDIFSPNFQVTDSRTGSYVKTRLGVHYRGVVRGQEGSVVAVSVFGDELMGLAATEAGNIVIGKIKGDAEERHVVYNDHDLPSPDMGTCLTSDDGPAYTREDLVDQLQGGRDANDCVNVYLEIDNSVFKERGSIGATTSYITALFNEVATLYANDGMNLKMGELFIWTTSDPYGTNVGTNLSRFRTNRPNHSGDIAALITRQGSGGVAYVDVLCSSQYGYSVSAIGNTNNPVVQVPTYSWSVNVLAHELGHNFGSSHTHACKWNGNATAIDGCYNPEGACGRPGLPSNGGTIMSYCHLTNVQVNFTNGFGPQPGALMRNRVAAATCLSACPAPGGGGGNGGGGGTPPNDPGSDDPGGDDEEPTTATLEIVLRTDSYPQETSWVLLTEAGEQLAKSDPLSGRNTTYRIAGELPGGCYTFIIRDTYGDGICCAWGNGSYSITVDGEEIASGGNFQDDERKDFCIELSDPGTDEPDEPEEEVCAALDFSLLSPGSYGGTQDRGSVEVTDENSGIYLSGNAWKAVALPYTVTPNTILEVEFASTRAPEIGGIGFDNDNGINSTRTFNLFGTQAWGKRDLEDYTGNGDFQTYQIPVGDYYTGNFNRLFFVADHDGGSRNGNAYFRNIRLYEGEACSTPTAGGLAGDQDIAPDIANQLAAPARIYPNPTGGALTLNATFGQSTSLQLDIHDLVGRVVRRTSTEALAGENRLPIDAAGLPNGTYLLRVTARDGYRETLKFTVQR